MIKWLQRLTVIRVVWCFQVSTVLHICHSLDPTHGPWSPVSKGLQSELVVIYQLGLDKPKNAFEHQLCLSSQSLIPGVLAGLVSLVLFNQHPPCTYCPGCHPCADPRAAFRRFFFQTLTSCECWRHWWLLVYPPSSCRMQHQWDTPLPTFVLRS